MRMDGVTLVALMAIASFAVERIVRGLLFLLAYIPAWSRFLPEPALVENPEVRVRAERKNRLVYFGLASILGVAVLGGLGNLRVLYAVGIDANGWLDAIFTGLILVGGSEKIAPYLKGVPGEAKKTDQPLEITGKLILEDGGGKRMATTQQ